MGLVIFAAMGLYLLISVGVVLWAIHYARKNGKSARRWGLSAALGMYLLVFWDWIPTVVAHKYYCSTEAGFWVYKTSEQWKAENPGVIETLVSNNGLVRKSVGDMNNYTDTSFMNQRFVFVAKHNGPFSLNRWRHEQEIVDSETNEVISRELDFSTSQNRRQAGWSGWKFWLDNRHCSNYFRNDGISIESIMKQVEGKQK